MAPYDCIGTLIQAGRLLTGLYQGITNPALQDVREAGLADIRGKLERLDGAGRG